MNKATHKTTEKIAVFYGNETWAMCEMDMKSLSTFEKNILRMVYGPVVQQGIWRIRTNQELWERCKNRDRVVGIKKKRLEMKAHVVRMDHIRLLKKNLRLNWREEEEWEDLN